MDDEHVVLSYPLPGVAEVRLNRPEQLNALLPATFATLARIGAELARDPDLRAVVLCGEGRAFCAGLDKSCFDAMRAPASGGASDSPFADDLTVRTHGIANAPQQSALVWRSLPVPVIAAIQGFALGGGLQIALGADVRFAREDAKFSIMEITWGLVPDLGGMLLFPELVRADILRELCLTGRVFSGSEAERIGIVTRLCDDPQAEALLFAKAIAEKSPSAIRATKRLLNLAATASPAEILLAESREQDRLIGSAEQMEAVNAKLAGRRPAYALAGD
jgi:enoyl-CoA hydratase/carnithine racemase